VLQVEAINTFYGSNQALYNVSLRVGKKEVVTLLGRNGMGKSTTVKSIMGIQPARSGSIVFIGNNIEKSESYQIARLGIGLVPEGRQIFPNLTVFENLMVTATGGQGGEQTFTLNNVLSLFPRLGERLKHLGSQLSGGEQQMLAIGRALMTNPRLLILDEATEGLAPLIRSDIWRVLEILKDKGLAILVIDKNLDALLGIADRHYIIEKGEIVWSGGTGDLRGNRELQARYIGV
jgi:branched-chain amino acid transport system ATP-binding protein